MGTVLLGWELGDVRGHVSKLLEVAQGWPRTIRAITDFAVARILLRDLPFPILQGADLE